MEAYEVRKVTVRALKYVCDMCGDTVTEKFSLIEPSQHFIGNHKEIKFIRVLTKLPLFGRLFYKLFFDKIYFNYEFIVTLLECSEHISTELSLMSHSLDYKKEIGELREEIAANVNDFVLAKDSLTNQFPGLVRFIKTKRASYHLLEYQLKQIETFEKQGLISENDKEEWQSKIEAKLVEVDNMTPSTKENIGDVKNLNIFLLNFPIFTSLEADDLQLIR